MDMPRTTRVTNNFSGLLSACELFTPVYESPEYVNGDTHLRQISVEGEIQ